VEDLKAVAGGRGETQGEHPQALFVLGKALLASGVAAEGVAALDAATRLDPALRAKAVPVLDQALVTGLREVSVFRLLGLLRLEGKEYLKSAETFLAGIKSVKDKADAGRLYLCLSHSLAGLGDKRKSREAMLQAHRISPEARAIEEEYQKLEDRRLAVETQGLRKDMEAGAGGPENLAARFRLAEALSEAGKHDEALGLLRLAEPGDLEGKLKAATLVGRIHVQRGQPGSAIEVLRSHAAPEDILSEPGLSYHYWLARAYEAAGEWPQAYACYQKAAAGNPNYQDLPHRLPRAARCAVAMDLRQGAGGPRVLEKTL